jgi:hypothetical protein
MTVYCEPVTAYRDFAGSLLSGSSFLPLEAQSPGGPDFDYGGTIRTAKENAV